MRIEVSRHNIGSGLVKTAAWDFDFEEVKKLDLEKCIKNLSDGLEGDIREDFKWEQFTVAKDVAEKN